MTPIGENAWHTLPWASVKGVSTGKIGLAVAPVARMTILACLIPVEVVSVNMEFESLKEMC